MPPAENEMKLTAVATIRTNFPEAHFWIVRRAQQSIAAKRYESSIQNISASELTELICCYRTTCSTPLPTFTSRGIGSS
ncbi:hypothetical protein ALO65_200287 [Pseudomonas syringae pv. papulans]|nr:hypothetical protein ALO65_200287 [Pseudomonas syringae pv. papulans]RMN79684.1 hypothetical protein ALQ56_200422 [Pseudomonas syringae pv. papulans]RMV37153.1 hypothetical protein ALP11_200173 [Pseudomonas syringae pv. papulans]